jgi:hypothetical protein
VLDHEPGDLGAARSGMGGDPAVPLAARPAARPPPLRQTGGDGIPETPARHCSSTIMPHAVPPRERETNRMDGVPLDRFGSAAQLALAWAARISAIMEARTSIEKRAIPDRPSRPVTVADLTVGLHRAPNDRGDPSDLAAILVFLGIPVPEQAARFVDADGSPIDAGTEPPATLTDLPPVDEAVAAALDLATSFLGSDKIGTRHIVAGLAPRTATRPTRPRARGPRRRCRQGL